MHAPSARVARASASAASHNTLVAETSPPSATTTKVRNNSAFVAGHVLARPLRESGHVRAAQGSAICLVQPRRLTAELRVDGERERPRADHGRSDGAPQMRVEIEAGEWVADPAAIEQALRAAVGPEQDPDGGVWEAARRPRREAVLVDAQGRARR